MRDGKVHSSMRVILRNKGKGLYYAGCSRWVEEPSGALSFDAIDCAGKLVFEEGVSEVEVVIIYDEANGELALPVRLNWDGGQLARVAV